MDWRNKRVVVIDDEAPARWLLALLFRQRGAEVFLAGDGQSGLQMVHEQLPDLVLLDILLPGMNGWQTLRVLRQSSEVPVVVLTSSGDSANEARCLDDGADDFVAKPFDREVLLARCWSAVRRYVAPATLDSGSDWQQKVPVGPAPTRNPMSRRTKRIGVRNQLGWRATG